LNTRSDFIPKGAFVNLTYYIEKVRASSC